MPTSPPRRAGPLEAGRLVLVAIRFLTRLPVGDPGFAEDDLPRATAAFPLVGLLVGGIGALTATALWAATSPVLAVLMATTVEVAVTGAFHEDGLADTFDGLWGGWDVEQRLEIMRDSRLGTYGTTALVLGLAVRVVCLAELGLGPDGLLGVVRATLVGHVLGRAAILVVARWLPAADAGGQGARVARPLGVGLWVAGTTTLVVLLATLGWRAGPVLGSAAIVVAAVGALWRARLGGVTGDTLGATQQLVHLAALVTLVGLR